MLTRVVFSGVLAVVLFVAPAQGQFVAEQITMGNVATDLFGGTDADGGIGDWYVSNGVIQAIIDDAGPQPDLVGLLGPAAPPMQSEANFTGGSIIDLGLVGKNNDQMVQMFTVGGLSTSNFVINSSISASTTPISATITVIGNLRGFDNTGTPVSPDDLDVVTEFTVANADPYMTVTTTVTNNHPVNPAEGLGGFLDAILWTQRGIVPFSAIPNRGFTHAVLDLGNPADSVELAPYLGAPGNVSPADGVMDPTNGTASDEVSYGILGNTVTVDPDGLGAAPGTVTNVNTLFGVSGTLVSAVGNLPGISQLDPGASLSYSRRIYVGDRNDVASTANAMITLLGIRRGYGTGTISGDLNAADTPNVAASVIATRTAGGGTPGFPIGTPATQFRTDNSGGFSGIVLPVGTYSLEFRAPERDPVTVAGVVVTAATNTAVVVPPMTGQGGLTITVFERVKGTDPQVPAKITIKGFKGTPDPILKKDFAAFAIPPSGPNIDLLPETFAGGPGQRNFLYLGTGTGTVQLRPGRYEIIASRGPEYSVRRKRVLVKEGTTKSKKLRIRRVLETPAAMSADFHIHSARSLDSSAPLRDRVSTFAAEGVEVMVSSDHDYHTSYAPIIAGLGIGNRITSIVGNEITTSVPNPPVFPDSLGHIIAWPLTVDPTARRDGSIDDEFVAPNWIFKRLRDQGAEVIQYNHPRAGVSGLTSIGFFNNIGYDPDLPITSPPNDILIDDDITGNSGIPNPDGIRNLDFDVLEIGNGTDVPGYLAVRRDWLSLLNQINLPTPTGPIKFIPGTGVSDTHRITLESAGYFRTYVNGVGDDPAALNVGVFDNKIKAGNIMATTGPYIEASISDPVGSASAGLGETLVPAGANVVLHVRVQATNWMPVEEVRVVVNGFVTPALTFNSSTTPKVTAGPKNPYAQNKAHTTRFEADIPLTLAADSYFIVEAGAKLSPLPTPPVFLDTIVPGLIPLAFANPIFVDLSGNGFDPPGLPVMASAVGVGEAVPLFARVQRNDLTMLAQLQEWWHNAYADLGHWGAAIAEEEDAAPTGTACKDKMERDKGKATAEYFPLYQLRIPQEAVDEAIGNLPAPEQQRLQAERRPSTAP